MVDYHKKLEKAEDELTQAISQSLAELMPQIQRKYHLSQRACTLAVSKAAINTAALIAMAGTGGSLAAAHRVGENLNAMLSKAVK